MRLSDYITEDNKDRCLKLRGLPFSCGVREIRDFFGDFRVSEKDVIIDMSHGQPTGYALVFLESADEAQRARKNLNKQNLRNRYIDVFFPEMK